MLNTWWFNVIAYLVAFTIFNQAFKFATKKSKKDGALAVLLELLGGLFILVAAPFFNFTFPSDIRPYLFLGLACVFYAVADRANITARRGLEVSIFSILAQFNTVFVILWGFIFFKEAFIWQKIVGTVVLIAGNALALYKKGQKFKLDKYVLFSLLGNLSLSIGISIDVGISGQFNLPIYVAITLILPALMIFVAERIKPKEIAAEFKHGNKPAIFLVGIFWGLQILFMLRSYQFGSIIATAPTLALTTIINVFAGYFLLKEKSSLLQKVIAAIIVIGGIVLINI